MNPTLNNLPPASFNQSGWPWTEESQSFPEQMTNDCQWPRISIVTPSYNQGEFIEETIRSVLLQGYPNLEYIIIDGGSTDNSVEIIKKYEAWIKYWNSQPDKGQTDAIQKGFNLCTGVLWNWLNSDDLLEPNALKIIAHAYLKYSSATMYAGKLTVFGQGQMILAPKCFQTLSELVCIWEKWAVPQPAVFLSRSRCLEVNGLNTSIQYAMDYELYLRLAKLPGFQVYEIDSLLARLRRHPFSKTVNQQLSFRREIINVFDCFAKTNLSILPKGWKRSRILFAYISDLKCLNGSESIEYNINLSLYNFIKISIPHIRHVWKYRYFWGMLRQQIQKAAHLSTIKLLNY